MTEVLNSNANRNWQVTRMTPGMHKLKRQMSQTGVRPANSIPQMRSVLFYYFTILLLAEFSKSDFMYKTKFLTSLKKKIRRPSTQGPYSHLAKICWAFLEATPFRQGMHFAFCQFLHHSPIATLPASIPVTCPACV